jgi:hypothetical protein
MYSGTHSAPSSGLPPRLVMLLSWREKRRTRTLGVGHIKASLVVAVAMRLIQTYQGELRLGRRFLV